MSDALLERGTILPQLEHQRALLRQGVSDTQVRVILDWLLVVCIEQQRQINRLAVVHGS